MDVERRLDQLELTPPAEAALPVGVEIPFAWVRIRGTRAYASGHGALAAVAPAGPVNAEPGYPQTTAVLNPSSELIIDLYGTDTGSHARTAIGVATVPLNLLVVSDPARSARA